jgi:hypothetical protein
MKYIVLLFLLASCATDMRTKIPCELVHKTTVLGRTYSEYLCEEEIICKDPLNCFVTCHEEVEIGKIRCITR